MAYNHVNSIVGSKGRHVKSRLDLVELGKRGVTKQALLKLADLLLISRKETALLLQVSERTLQRYGATDVLSAVLSDRVIQLAEIVEGGMELFKNDRERFADWLRTPSVALGGKQPLEMLPSAVGTQMVMDELMRMAYGIYS